MKRQVLAYVKPAAELAAGDRLLTGRITVAEVKAVEAFEDSSKRQCVEARTADGAGESVAIFVAEDMVLVLE